MSRRELADALNAVIFETTGEVVSIDANYIGKLERGVHRWPNARYRKAFREILGALKDAELGFYVEVHPLKGDGDNETPAFDPAVSAEAAGTDARVGLAECWEIDDAAALGTELGATSAADPAGQFGRIAHQWLITPPPQTVELAAGRRVGASLTAKLERRIAQLRHLDDFVGGRDLQVLVERELSLTSRLVSDATYSDVVGRRLLTAVAELCWLAGWVATDAGNQRRARARYTTGIKAAHAAGDRAGAANLISTIGYDLTNTGNPADGVLAARTAITGAGDHASATTRALLFERVAWAHACAGQADQTKIALDAVEYHYQRHDPQEDPEWVYWLDRDEIDIMAARCLIKIGLPDRAIDLLSAIVDRYSPQKVRELALYTSWLSEAHLDADNIDQAAAHATRTAELTALTASTRSDERVQTLAARLRPYEASAAVRDFIDVVKAV